MRELHLFAGAGGGILGGILLGHTCVCAVEIEPYCRKVLLQRQRDGILPKFPIWDDVRTFDGKPWKGLVDVVCGGFPCQDISAAGKGEGIDGERSGLWTDMARIIREVEPACVLVENSPRLTVRGLGRVLGDLASMGLDARWGVLGARHAGAPQERDRVWILAHTSSEQAERFSQGRFFSPYSSRHSITPWDNGCVEQGMDGQNRSVPPGISLVADGMAEDVERLETTGNGQVPAVVKLAWETLSV